jgi:hypothetical protein
MSEGNPYGVEPPPSQEVHIQGVSAMGAVGAQGVWQEDGSMMLVRILASMNCIQVAQPEQLHQFPQ